MSRTIYLEDIPLDQAWGRFRRALEDDGQWSPLEGEEIEVAEALGRVTAEPVWAVVSSPHYHAAAMDGYAVRAADTHGATETAPLRLPIGSRGVYVDTGDPLPPDTDAVIPIENVQVIAADGQPQRIEILAAVPPWRNVRSMGEDMVATELVLPANHTLRPVDLGAVAGSGHKVISVRRRPRVAIIPTGTELVPAGSSLRPGDIIEYNSIVLGAQVQQWGGSPTRYPITPDRYDLIRDTIADAAQKHDLVLVNAGSSAGSEDFTARAVEELGKLLVHGVAVRPGHPVILGWAGVPIVGVPGFPVSAALTGEIFVEPLLARWRGQSPEEHPTVQASMTRKLLSPMGEDEYVRVTVGQVGNRMVAAPLSRGAGVITSLVRADGIVRIPRFSEGVHAGETVTVHLYRPRADIHRTIVAIGSHDLTLDLLAQHLAEHDRRLSSANAGSLGGLLALRRGEAHLAGSHLLDEVTGDYNRSFVRQYLPNLPVVLVTLVRREQGLIVAPGNPKGIHHLADLNRPDVRMVNRQRGAGTRILLDYRLATLGIRPEQLQGYDREEYTHLAVAAAVASGAADVGLGIRAAARALNLDFMSLEFERYDLIIPQETYDGELLRPLLEVIRGEAFRLAVAALPGYDVSDMGKVVEM